MTEHKITPEQIQRNKALAQLLMIAARWPMGSRMFVPQDGFEGTVVGYYFTREEKPGVVLQLLNARVVHVYSEPRVERTPHSYG